MRILILAMVALATIIGAAFFLGTGSPALPENMESAQIISSTGGEKTWIEILSGKVFEFDINGKLIRELKTGDTIEEEKTIDASTGALANIYFGDGSILNINSETKIQIQKNEFEKTNGKLLVKIGLTLGRAWSQIKSLATTDSEWQIETPNAVATVRGTSFGVEFAKGKSTIVVFENKVEVAAKDPISREIIESSKTTVSEKEFVIVDEEDLAKIKAEKRTLKIEKVGNEILNRVWIKKATKQEKSIETIKTEEIKKIEEMRQENKNIETRKIENIITPRELKIINKTSLETILEGEKLKFEAVLVLSNSSEKVVTSEVAWQVLGGIGTIGKDGTFLPKLDDTVAEFGSAFGNIIAIWKDKETQKELLGKTPIFKVGARITEEEIQNFLEPRG